MIIAAVVAIGAGLHVAAYFLEEKSVLSAKATMITVTIPVAVYFLGIFGLYTYLARTLDRFHLVILAATAVNLIAPLVMADSGVSMPWCLLVLSFTPWLTVDRLRVARPRRTTRACFRASRSSRRRTGSAERPARARRAASPGRRP